jgi:hypothetical protein
MRAESLKLRDLNCRDIEAKVGVGYHFSPRYYCASKHIRLMTPSMAHVSNLTPPGSGVTTLGFVLFTALLMTLSMVHEGNLTPGSECNLRLRWRR